MIFCFQYNGDAVHVTTINILTTIYFSADTLLHYGVSVVSSIIISSLFAGNALCALLCHICSCYDKTL